MQTENLSIQVIPCQDLSQSEYREVVELCSQAFRRDYTPFLETFHGAVHLLGRFHGKLVSHALWVTRWLQYGDLPLLRTAYVEGVDTEISYRSRGFCSAIMRRLAEEVQDFDLAALSTSSITFYKRLDWLLWRGPLFVRTESGPILIPHETAMVLCLPKTPDLDLEASLSVEWREGELW
jgi:hypothetical protein